MAQTFLDAINRAESGVGAAIQVPEGSVTLADTTSTQTFTNKTLTSPTITSAVLTSPVINGSTGVSNVTPYAADGAISLTSHVALLTKTSAGAYTVAAPGTAGIRITLTAGTNFAHVITFTGSTLGDGTTGLNLTVTMAAFIGSSITVIANTATQWVVESQNTITSIVT